VSAFAHWLENAGISTVVIGLVKMHLEKIRPPRALWVPFELGRPCGAPSESEFQRRVLLQALQMVETSDKPWQPPQLDSAKNISEETTALKSHYQRYCVRQSRTSVGVAKTPVADLATLFDRVFEDKKFSELREDLSPRLMYRLALDDLKAYYIEAALASEYQPCSKQVYDWLWEETLLGTRMKEMRKRLMTSDDVKHNDLGTSTHDNNPPQPATFCRSNSSAKGIYRTRTTVWT